MENTDNEVIFKWSYRPTGRSLPKKEPPPQKCFEIFQKSFYKKLVQVTVFDSVTDIFESQRIKRFETSRRSLVLNTLKLEMPEDILHHLTEVAIN